MKKIFFIIALLFPFIAHADVYQWTAPDGSVHFSDTPREGATQVQLQDEPSVLSSKNNNGGVQDAANNDATPHTYSDVSITAPTNNFTFVNNETGMITVAVETTPSLQSSDRLNVLMDGKAVDKPQAGTNINISGIERGQHSLIAQVIDPNGKVLATSGTVTFFMQRPRILPNVPQPLKGNTTPPPPTR